MASKSKTQQTTTSSQPAPGAMLHTPNNPVQPRIVQETGPCAAGTVVTLNTGTSAQSPYQKFQTLDVVRGYLLELGYTTTFDGTGATPTITASPLAPWTAIGNIGVQFESAYKTFNATGPLAAVWQSFRPMFAPKTQNGPLFASGAGGVPAVAAGDGIYSPYTSTPPMATPNFTLNTAGDAQNWRQFIEIPVTSPIFDSYWDLNVAGQIQGNPFHRAEVSPQYMAATTRNVTPQLTWNPLLSTNNLGSSLASIPIGGTSTASGSVSSTWYRDAWLPPASGGSVYAPPVFGWQYSRDYLSIPYTGGNGGFPITLDSTTTGQGQIMSIVCYIWDPALNSGAGGITPIDDYDLVELLYGSTVDLRQQAPEVNLYEWAELHGGYMLPSGFFGWDLAMTRDGKLTNEHCLNTLIQAGSQVRLTFGTPPSTGSTVYVGIESLKKVGS